MFMASTSGAELSTAWGTVLAATFAAVGLFIALRMNRDDRERNNQQAKADRESAANIAAADRTSAAEVAAADRATARDEAERRHIVDLLLELGRQVSTYEGYKGSDTASQARHEITILLSALPPECVYTVRQHFGLVREIPMPGAVGAKLQYLKLGSVGADADVNQMGSEIAYDIDRYLTSGRAPRDVWSDLADQEAWHKARRPGRL